jgi:HSP20 family protein
MRYRRLTYRYAMIVTATNPGALQPFEDPLRTIRPGVALTRTLWSPPADVYETRDSIIVTVAVAGLDDRDVELLLYEDALVVEGRRRLPPPVEAEGVYRAVEIRQGPFRVEIPLDGPVDHERVEAKYEQGLLRVTLPKSHKR